jgi:CO/xanthine dehydrogenase Mo-binding subunit
VWSATQVPYIARSVVAETLELSERNVRVIVPHLGGGFGGKCEVHFEPHVAALARAARRPVQLVLTREECFIAPDMNRHPMTISLRTGVRRDGTIVARTAQLTLDTGAYATHGPIIAEVATMVAAGPYRIPHLKIEANVVYTTRTPAGSTRAPSGPQVCWALEQHTDALADRVGLDPITFRMLNLVDEGDEGPTGQILSSVGVRECLGRAQELIAEDNRSDGGDGFVGFACGWWQGGMPSPSDCTIKLNSDGTATVTTGAQENGSGAVMGLALLVAEELGIDPDQVALTYQDTDLATFDAGSLGSQTTFNNGRAVVEAAAAVAARLRELAADELEIDPADLELEGGAVRLRGAPERAIPIADLVATARANGEVIARHAAPPPPPLPDSFGGSCAGRLVFPSFSAPSFFCHAARVVVDSDSGVVTVRKLVACHDLGRVLNRIGAEGQVEGGVVHSLGMALSEGSRLAADGRQLNPRLTDYKLCTAADVPPIVVEFIQPEGVVHGGGPYGSKGAGEVPVIGTAGAVANAVAAATGKRIRQLPMTPERIWSAPKRTQADA